MRVMLVDDEQNALDTLSYLLRDYPEVFLPLIQYF